jgi:PAS domain S-box-containing protein
MERQMGDVFDHVPMGVAVFDRDLRLLHCNPAWTEICARHLGVPPTWVGQGKSIVELVPDQEAAGRPLLQDVLAGRVARRSAQRVSVDGQVTYWDVVLAPTFADGEVVGFVDIMADATDRVRAHQQLELRVAAFTAIADSMTLEHPLEQTLRHVARGVRAATGAEAAAVVVWEDEALRNLTAYGDDGLPDGYRGGVEAAYALGVDSPIRNVTTASDVTVIRGFRARAEQDPGYAPLHPIWAGMQFDDTVVVPLGARGRCVGCLLLYVSAGREVGADERAFLRAVADQAAVAVENAQLFGQPRSRSASRPCLTSPGVPWPRCAR